MAQEIHQHTLANGLTLLAERMPHVRSAAFSFMVPAGCVYDPPERLGLASVLMELITRGAGNRDSRQVSEALDGLGLDRSESAGAMNVHFSGATLSRNLPAALEVYADIVRRPHLPEDELEPVKALAMQDIQSLEDEPQHRVMVELSKRHYPDPLGRDRRGTAEGVSAIGIDDLRAHHARFFQPKGAILAVAGDIQWGPLRDRIEQLFGDWKPQEPPALKVAASVKGSEHIDKDIDQTQISLAFPSVPIGDPDFYNARGAVGVLSLDMSSRLFMEVREKHGLCYSVYATYETFRDRASIVCYAGARPEKAQETLDRTLHELKRLKDGIEDEEVDRVRVGLKAALIMRQESTSARAGSLASDWYYLGRVRPLEEVQAAINGLTPDSILGYLHRHPARDFTVVTLGPEALRV